MMISSFDNVGTPDQSPQLKEVDVLLARIVELRDKKDGINHQLKDINSELGDLEQKMISTLEAAELTSFDGTTAKVSVTNRFSVKVPQSLDRKLAFFEFLKKRKIFNELVSVNSATLNSFFKTEMEAAKNRGEFDFKIPGLEEPSHSQSLSVRRK